MQNKLIEKLTVEDLPEPYKTIAEVCGMDAVVKLAEHFGGSQPYFQKLDTIIDSMKERNILQEFNGYNYDELARKYNCSTRWVREITSDITKKVRNKPLENQLSLFTTE